MQAHGSAKGTSVRYFNCNVQGPESSASGFVFVVVAFVGVRGAFALLVEGLPAAARGPVVRVRHHEAGSGDRLAIVDRGPVEVLRGLPVDHDADAVVVDDLVALPRLVVEGQAV